LAVVASVIWAGRRRHVLLVDVTQAAAEVSRLVREAYDLNLPVEPASARAAMRWSAGPFYWRRCCPRSLM